MEDKPDPETNAEETQDGDDSTFHSAIDKSTLVRIEQQTAQTDYEESSGDNSTDLTMSMCLSDCSVTNEDEDDEEGPKLTTENPNFQEIFLEPVERKSNWKSLKDGVTKFCKLNSNPSKEFIMGRSTEQPTIEVNCTEKYPSPSDLNELQTTALQQAMSKSFSIIHGPPGTGKTVLSAAIIIQALKYDSSNLQQDKPETSSSTTKEGTSREPGRILACAGTNHAADELARKVSNRVRNSSLALKVLRVYSKQLEQQEHEGSPEKRKDFDILHIEVLKHLQKSPEFRMFQDKIQGKKWYEYTASEEKSFSNYWYEGESSVLKEADIIISTNQTAGDRRFVQHGIQFTTLLLDEAGQLTEPLTLLPFLISKPIRTVLMGDPMQLKPFVHSNSSVLRGYGMSMMERLMRGPAQTGLEGVIQLTQQYRSHSVLCKFTSSIFYNDSLISAVDDSERIVNIPNEQLLVSLIQNPFLFINCNGEERKKGESIYNPAESSILAKIVKLLLDNEVGTQSLGILSFYEAQSQEIKQRLIQELTTMPNDLEVENIDGVQGREKEIIIISCVRSNLGGDIGFLKEPNRVNVATSRARSAMIIIGNAATLEKCDPTWKRIINFAKSQGVFKTIDVNTM